MKQEFGKFIGAFTGLVGRGIDKLIAPPKSEIEWAQRVIQEEAPSDEDINSYVNRRKAAINLALNYQRGDTQLQTAFRSDFLGLQAENELLNRGNSEEIVPLMKKDAQDLLKRAAPPQR